MRLELYHWKQVVLELIPKLRQDVMLMMFARKEVILLECDSRKDI
jgi:hypothetical protein